MNHVNREHLNYGARLLAQGQAQAALDHFEAMHRENPQDVVVLINLGGACILCKKFKRAIPLLEAATEIEPDNPMIWTNLGAAYLGNPVLASDEQQVRAIAAFERALALDPHSPNVAYNIGLIYRDRGALQEAIEYFERALLTDPDDRDAQRLLSQLQQEIDANWKPA